MNRGKFISSYLVTFCFKKFEKFALSKSVSQSEVIFIGVFLGQSKGGHKKN